MTQDNKYQIRLVQIEPVKRSEASSEDGSEVAIDLPALSDREIYRRKAYIAFRKIIGFFYTKHSYGAVRRWVLAKMLPDRILYRWKPYQRGGCNRCGLCCKIVFRCPFFYEDENTTACLIYTSPKHALRPASFIRLIRPTWPKSSARWRPRPARFTSKASLNILRPGGQSRLRSARSLGSAWTS